jgi:hypothetical protein
MKFISDTKWLSLITETYLEGLDAHNPDSSKGRTSLFKIFMGLVSMCQRSNHRLDVIEQKLDANAYNQRLIHSKL